MGIIVVVWYIVVVIVVSSLLANEGCGRVAAVLYRVIIVIFASSALTIAGWHHQVHRVRIFSVVQRISGCEEIGRVV